MQTDYFPITKCFGGNSFQKFCPIAGSTENINKHKRFKLFIWAMRLVSIATIHLIPALDKRRSTNLSHVKTENSCHVVNYGVLFSRNTFYIFFFVRSTRLVLDVFWCFEFCFENLGENSYICYIF